MAPVRPGSRTTMAPGPPPDAVVVTAGLGPAAGPSPDRPSCYGTATVAVFDQADWWLPSNARTR